jgi:hypothetical protein
VFRPNFKMFKVFRLGLAYANQQLKDIEISSGLVYFVVELSQADWLSMSDLSAAVGVDNAYATRAVSCWHWVTSIRCRTKKTGAPFASR